MSTYRYDKHDVATLYAKLIDPAFLEARCRHRGDRNITVRTREVGGSVEVTVERDVEAPLPGFAKRLFNPVNRVVEKARWTPGDTATCRWEVDVKGTPTTVSGTTRIEPDGAGARMVFDYQVSAPVPLVRSKLEAYVREQTEDGLRLDAEYNRTNV